MSDKEMRMIGKAIDAVEEAGKDCEHTPKRPARSLDTNLYKRAVFEYRAF